METHSSILTWKIPWTEEPGALLSTGSQRVRHDLASKQQQQYNTYLNSCLIQHTENKMYSKKPCHSLLFDCRNSKKH